MIRTRTKVVLAATAVVLAVAVATLRGEDEAPSVLRDGFESSRTAWRQEETDATVNLIAHERSNRAAHEGRASERFQFDAGPGSAFFFSYPLPRIPVNDALKVGLFVRATRGGVRLYGRVVLPADTDPDTGQPSFVLVPGTIYDNVDRWQRLELVNLMPSIERQARVLRATTRRPVSLEGAYIERLVVNLFGGVGEAEVFLDELTIEPVPAEAVAAQAKAEAAAEGVREAPEVKAPKSEARGAGRVQLDRNRLRRRAEDGRLYDWFFTAIQAPGADVAALRRAGFDVLAESIDADRDRIQDAVKRGFLLMPGLDETLEGAPVDPERMVEEASSYPFRDAVAFWNLGEHLGRSRDPQVRAAELERVRATISGVRGLPGGASRLTTATVDGDLPLFAAFPKNLDILGVRPNPWASAQDPTDTYTFLTQRREMSVLKNAEALFWAWLPAAAPPSVRTAVWGQDVPPAWGYPQIQPEQLRLFTYLALSAGYRGIGFRGDAELTRNSGRALLIEMALLNEEIDLCESILANGSDPIPIYRVYFPDPSNLPVPGQGVNQRIPTHKEADPHPGIRAAGIATADRRGVLLLVADYDGIAQFQQSQAAANNLKITVPVPESAQAYEITPGDVRVLERERVPGGTRITMPDFGPTALILVTTDAALPERIKAALTRVRPLACQLAIEQAELQLQWVADIIGRLVADNHKLYDPSDPKTPPLAPNVPVPNDEAELLAKAEETIKSAREALEREDYPLAWSEARRVGRPLRHLMFNHWIKANSEFVKAVLPPEEDPRPARLREQYKTPPKKDPHYFVTPVCSPPLASFNTLPQQYIWLDWIKQGTFGRNLIPSGSFDDHESLESAGWIDQSYQFEGITSKVMTVEDDRDRTRRVLKMSVEPTDSKKLDDLSPFLDFPAAAIRSPALRVTSGEFLRITVSFKKRNPNVSGAGGLIITDSIGGEPLQLRATGSMTQFTKVVLFRRAPADGIFTVTLGLAGYGIAQFDDFRVEPLVNFPTTAPANLAGRARPPRARPDDAPATARRRSPGRSSR